MVKIYCGWDFEPRILLNLMGTEHLNPLGSLKISASITNALLIITRFVHDSSGAQALPSVMWLCRRRHPAQAALLAAHLVTALLTRDQEAASNSIMIAELSLRGLSTRQR